MFGFSKKKDTKKAEIEPKKQPEISDKKNGKYIDKLVMGAILGGAIGSVVGLSLAPKKGEETRKIVKDKAKEIIDGIKDNVVKPTPHPQNTANKLEPRGGLFSRLGLSSSKGKSSNEDLKKIPNEIE